MKYVSEEVLRRGLEWTLKEHHPLIEWFLNHGSKELPDQQWQTIDEFKANPVIGWCWVRIEEDFYDSTEIAFYDADSCFYENMDFNFNIDVNYITHVMPIKTPEAPK